ncbi:MAG: SprB repeat-containing protein [Sphingobacteriales bacterium]|nr:MAG: SprB repeat-containing protein [Sphingobacteriales bacterium]
MRSYAYNTNPYDDYFFSDLKLRIHKDDEYSDALIQYAYINEDARYPDGNYFLLASATTVNGDLFDSDPSPIVIDNFRPYIKEVLITQGGLPRYHAVWEWDAEFNNGSGNPPGRLEYNRITITSVLTSGEDLAVQIIASEPMDEISFTIEGTTDIHTAIDYSENTSWFEISSSFLETLIVNDYHTLNITGQDLTLNYLTGFPSSPPPSSPPDYTAAQLPHRTGATSSSWSIPFSNTTDRAHFFYLSNCFPGEGESGPCILDAGVGLFNSCGNAFNSENEQLCAGATLQVYDFSCAACAETAEWNFDGGTAVLVDADPDYYSVSWDTPGTYTVSLSLWGSEAFNENGIDNYSQTITVSETGCVGNGMVVGSIGEACNILTIIMLNGVQPFTVSMLGQQTNFATNTFQLNTENIPIGDTYFITITDAVGCSTEVTGQKVESFYITANNLDCWGNGFASFNLNFYCGTPPYSFFVGGELITTSTSSHSVLDELTGGELLMVVTESQGQSNTVLIQCTVVNDECQNDTPVFLLPETIEQINICAGEEICLNYYVRDATSTGIYPAVCSVENATHTYQSGFYNHPDAPNYDDAYYWQSGTFCFTPDIEQIGLQVITLSASDITASWCQETGLAYILVNTLCCPTGFDYPQELTAVYDCDGNLYQPAEATVMALTNGCNLDFTLNGSADHTLGHLGEGVYDLTLSFNNQTYLIEDAITVSGIYMDDGNLQITHTTQPSLAACSSDQCNGQISLSVSGGSGNYTYHWSDCIPPPGEMMLPCNSPLRNHLCSGSYTVTVADDLTDCETVYTANVNLYYPPNAGVLSDNEFSVSPTVFSGSTTLTYRVGYDAQVSISMFNGQGILVDSPIQQEFRAEGQYSMTHSPPSGLPQGVYYYVLYVCEQYITRVAIKID